MKDSIEVTYHDTFSAHGEQVIHSLLGDNTMLGSYTWPEPYIPAQDWRSKQVIVAKVGGIVAGRAFLANDYYPITEFENFVVDPAYRGQGVGSRLLEFAITRAADMGYLALHLQTDLDNRQAHNIYVRNGFIPATQGEMLRMIRFLSYPALSRFQMDHPLALLHSVRNERGPWELCWQDPVNHDSLSILLSGGSCQGDSNGYAPGIAGFETITRSTAFSADISGPGEVSRGSEFGISVKLHNKGGSPVTGACRLLLNAGFEPDAESGESRPISIEPDGEQEITLGVRLTESLKDISKEGPYASTAVAVEFLVDGQVFWLSHEVKTAAKE